MGSAITCTLPHLRDAAQVERQRDADCGLMPADSERDAVKNAQVQANRRLGWILGSVAVAFFVGFIVKISLLSGKLV